MSDLFNPRLPRHLPPPLFDGPPRTWWKRNWTWCLPLAMLLLVLALCGLAAAGYGILLEERRGRLPYSEAIRRVHCSPELAAKLGEPIVDATFAMWLSDGSEPGDMVSVINGIDGPRGSGRLMLRARRVGGTWEYDILYVQLKDGSDVALEGAEYSNGGCPRRDSRVDAG